MLSFPISWWKHHFGDIPIGELREWHRFYLVDYPLGVDASQDPTSREGQFQAAADLKKII